MEEVTIRHRSRLKGHFTVTSNVILFGYAGLTDVEKLTYQVIDSFDWSDGRGERKGYAFPSLTTLARLRRIDVRTVRRHLASLERVGLITREYRPGQPNLLWIEEPSDKECEAYLSTIDRGEDTDVRGTPDTDVRPYNEEDEIEEDVNVQQELSRAAETVALTGSRNPEAMNDEARAKREYYAGEILAVTGDRHSLGCYRRIASRCPPDIMFEALSIVRQMSRDGSIRTVRGALFVDLVKRSCLDRGIDLQLSDRRVQTEELTQHTDAPSSHTIRSHAHNSSSNTVSTQPLRGP